jgi:pimeloyl-ACP methyl ester carboxylesterase
MSGKRVLRALYVMLSLVLLSTNNVYGAQAQDNPFPAPTGQYKVGVVWRHWVDQARTETFDTAPHGKREMMVEFLYPASPSANAKPATYMANRDRILPAFADVLAGAGAPLTLAPADFASFQSHSFPGAPLASDLASYPVLIFSHGAGGEVTMYTTQLEELASQGYVVVAIDHAYGAAATVFPDGRSINANFSSGLDGAAPVWAQDQIFVMDQLQTVNENDPDKLFTKHLDLNRLGVFGHSLGGSTATITCFLDKRCKAGASEDGPVYGDVIQKGLDQPFMYMISDHRFFYNPDDYNKVRGPFYEVAFKGFEHLNFGDFPLWPGVQAPLNKANWLGSVDGPRSVKLTRAYLVAFFDKFVKGTADGALLHGSSKENPEVTIKARNMKSS